MYYRDQKRKLKINCERTYMCDLHPTTAVCCGAHAALRYGASRRAHDLCRALDVNAHGTRMRNRVIAHARVCFICMAPHCGCVWCGCGDADHAAHMRLRLVLSRMSLLWRAVQVVIISRCKGACAYAWVRCRYGV